MCRHPVAHAVLTVAAERCGLWRSASERMAVIDGKDYVIPINLAPAGAVRMDLRQKSFKPFA